MMILRDIDENINSYEWYADVSEGMSIQVFWIRPVLEVLIWI